MKEIIVSVRKYESIDGKVFDTEDECNHYEKLLSGERKICHNCNGRGRTPDEEYRYPDYYECGTCNGKGWLEKKEKWE